MGNALEQSTHFFATKEEYLELEAKAAYKSEYLQGEVVAMSGGSINHSTIGVNTVAALHRLLRGTSCRVLNSDTKLEVDSFHSYVYPDAMVICGEVQLAEGRNDIVKNPILIVEVLSPSTENLDRGKKFRYHQSLPSLQEYVLISSNLPYVESYYRQSENSWHFTVTKAMASTLYIQSLELHIALADLYENILFEETN